MKELNHFTFESYNECDMTPTEIKKLRQQYPVLRKHFTSYQYLEVYRNNGEVVALVIDNCIIHTYRGEFSRSYANRLLKIKIIGLDENYMYIIVNNGLNKLKRLDISLPIKDKDLISE